MQKVSGFLLIAIGLVHTSFGLSVGYRHGHLQEVARAGFVNAIKGPSATLFWFLFFGFAMMLLGHLCLWVERRLNHPLPVFLGWELLVLSAVSVVLMPASGWWLVMAAALNMIVAAHRAAANRSI